MLGKKHRPLGGGNAVRVVKVPSAGDRARWPLVADWLTRSDSLRQVSHDQARGTATVTSVDGHVTVARSGDFLVFGDPTMGASVCRRDALAMLYEPC